MSKMFLVCLATGMLFLASPSWAAIGCTLGNPAHDLKALFPSMTSYREDVKSLSAFPDGKALFEALKQRVGDLDPVYELYDTPYTLYSVFHGEQRLGYVHGVNVPGRGGVIQVFLAVEPEAGAIRAMFFQRLESPGGSALRGKAVRDQFAGLTLADFYRHDRAPTGGAGGAADTVARLVPPSGLPDVARPDWEATLRGVRKNLILLDFFAFGRQYEPVYQGAESPGHDKGINP